MGNICIKDFQNFLVVTIVTQSYFSNTISGLSFVLFIYLICFLFRDIKYYLVLVLKRPPLL